MSVRIRLLSVLLLAGALAVDLAAQAPVPAPSSAPAPVGASRVVGRVLSGSAALSDAQVTLYRFTNNVSASDRWTATTGGDGTFDLANVPAGSYRVVAERSGYSGMTLTATGGMSMGHTFTLGDGEVAHVDLVLHPAGTIRGRVTHPDGSPAAGAMVMASLSTGVDSQARRLIGLRAPVAADADGRYVIADVPPGSFAVQASSDRRLASSPRDLVPTLFPSLLESETAEAVVVAAGEVTDGIDIRLRRAADQHRLSGQVVDAGGGPVRSVRLLYGDVAGQVGGEAAGIGADGRFSVSASFAAGSTVSVVARGVTDDGPGVGVGTAQIGGTATAMPPIVLQKPGAIVGRLVARRPMPPEMAPLLRAYHEHVRPMPVIGDVRDDRVSVDADGRFRVDGVIGRQQFVLQPLPAGWRIIEIRRRGVRLDEGVVTVPAGEVVDSVEIVVGLDE